MRAPRAAAGRERTMNFESDEVARVAAEMAEAALDGPLHVKICNGCGSAMSSKLRVCRQCRNMNNRQTQYKGVKMKNNSTKWQARAPGRGWDVPRLSRLRAGARAVS